MTGRTRFKTATSKGEAVAQCIFFTFCFLVLGVLTGGILLLVLPLVWVNLAFELNRLSVYPGNTANQTLIGPRGRRYRINSNGKKVYY